MGKAGFLTPKAIANRIKSKGLQKLRWFCQMCQKQCRDENGFKCHLTSESHQRQLLLFADNPDKYIDGFSQEFMDTFLELLSRRFGTKRVQANIVYQEYISDRLHTHMNSTQWETLTDFVKWLGREGHCVVDETEKGWYMQYIDRNPEVIRKQEALAKKEKMTLDDAEKTARFIQQQVERATTSREDIKPEFTDLKRDKEEEKVAFSLTATKKSTELPSTFKKPSPLNPLQKIEEESSESLLAGAAKDDKSSTTDQKSSVAGHKRKSALDDIMKMEEEKKEKQSRKDYWLHEGIVVKIITKKLGEKYYKKKGVIKEVLDRFACVIKMLDSGDRLKLDQAHLETVIPALGKEVLVVNGAHRGCPATLLEMDTDHFCCSIKLSSGRTKGRVVHAVQYEDISKLHVT